MSFILVLATVGCMFMLSTISKAVQRYCVKVTTAEEAAAAEEEEDVGATVKSLLGTPASARDRKAVDEFMDLIQLVKRSV